MKHFGKGGTNRKGFWISKFMKGQNGTFTPNNAILKTDEHEAAFFNTEIMTRENNPYGLDYTAQIASLPRDTEYGALYYLTGISNPQYHPNPTNTSDISNKGAATFGNETGVYDLNNGVREWTADISWSKFKEFQDRLKQLYMSVFGTDTHYMKKDQNGIYIDKTPLIGKVRMVLNRIITSGSDKSYGGATLEFMTDYSSTDAAPYGGKSITVGKNNPYNTRTSDISGANKSVYSFEGVDRNPGNIGYRAVLYAYEPQGVEIITPDTPAEDRERLLRDNKGKYVKVTFKSEAIVYQLETQGYDDGFGTGNVEFYIPKGSKFPYNLATKGIHRQGPFVVHRFLGWNIHPKSQEFYKDTVIEERYKTAETKTITHRRSSRNDDGSRDTEEWEETKLIHEPYDEPGLKGDVKAIDENFGYMHNFGSVPIDKPAALVARAKLIMPGYSPIEYEIEPGLSYFMFFSPDIENTKVYDEDLILSSLLMPDEIDKYKVVRYYIKNPEKQYIGEEVVVAGNKPEGLQSFTAPQGTRLSGISPSLDTVVTDDMEIEYLLESTQKLVSNPVELTVNLDGGRSQLMQHGEKLRIERGSRLSDPNNISELNRIRATVPIKLGYRFKGWSVSEHTPINDNTEIKALWERERVKVTYTASEADGGYIQTKNLNAGEAPGNPDREPERKGYKFQSWNPSTSIPVYSDTTYTAIWVKKDESGEKQDHPNNGDNKDKNDNNGSGNNGSGDNNSGDNGNNNSGNNGTGNNGNKIFEDAGDIKIYNPNYGKLTEKDYDESTVPEGRTRLIFETEGGTWKYPSSFEIDNGNIFSTYKEPKKEGYEFVGWDKDWQVANGKIQKYKAKWLRKEINNNDNNGSGNNNSGRNNNNSRKWKFRFTEIIMEDMFQIKTTIVIIMVMEQVIINNIYIMVKF